jgi:hypothetical protein
MTRSPCNQFRRAGARWHALMKTSKKRLPFLEGERFLRHVFIQIVRFYNFSKAVIEDSFARVFDFSSPPGANSRVTGELEMMER